MPEFVRRLKIWQMLLIFLVFVSFSLGSAAACPFCPAPTITFSERYAQSDVVLLVQWVSYVKRTKEQPGSTTFEILQIAKQDQPDEKSKKLNRQQRITTPRDYFGKPGELFMLFGHYDKELKWTEPFECTETAFHYVQQSPRPEAAIRKRLLFFLRFLEYQDQLIASDAFNEFAKADYDDVASITEKLPREKLRTWLTAKETPATRLGLYGLMLGLCGTKDDLPRMEKIIMQHDEQEFRLGIDGVIGGYLLLRGADGLAFIEKHKFQDEKCPISETFSAMNALRFIWTFGRGGISKDRLRQSMRNLLDEPRLTELAITDLARWKDWEMQDRLRELYNKTNYPEERMIAVIRLAIVQYLLASTIDLPKDSSKPLPKHVVKGRKLLKQIEKQDPKTVRHARRRFSPG